ncbi:hypothetical protein RISK_000542 [Rhodopirellula islandica]|uniref:Uncharacterized protein n=1 Tax=Rhodopirellula islandica TaxID=595434 RepID=A0A0J1EPQ7_RHOIS|nr:hypothetical protein RISK_000542 [Rhodopirellula islandica]
MTISAHRGDCFAKFQFERFGTKIAILVAGSPLPAIGRCHWSIGIAFHF